MFGCYSYGPKTWILKDAIWYPYWDTKSSFLVSNDILTRILKEAFWYPRILKEALWYPYKDTKRGYLVSFVWGVAIMVALCCISGCLMLHIRLQLFKALFNRSALHVCVQLIIAVDISQVKQGESAPFSLRSPCFGI